ncbi:hypothetical protein [Nostoc sp.]|uniref:hypothetical protein n=1 Tax=Nostoc sp. TaxID=1180 RepID=UPI002FF5450C
MLQNLPECDRYFLPLCSLCLCGSLKRAIACKIPSVRSLSSDSVSFAPLWFVKKSVGEARRRHRLKNFHRAIALQYN